MNRKCPAYNGAGKYAFVSYSHKDSEAVYNIISALTENGFRVWYDEGLPLITNYAEMLYNKITRSSVVLSFLSKDSVSSPEVEKELRCAVSAGIPICFISLDGSAPAEDIAFHATAASRTLLCEKTPRTFFDELCSELCRCGAGEQTAFVLPEKFRKKTSIIAAASRSYRAKATLIVVSALILCCAVCAFIISRTGSSAAGGTAISGELAVGSVFELGSYEQDGDTSNGAEPIKWIVLDRQDGKALVLCENALECRPYNESHTPCTWEESSLCKWLNASFYYAAFSASERKTVVDGGNDVGSIFCLSADETEKYDLSEDIMTAAPTVYAVDSGAFSSDGACLWWLRGGADVSSAVVDCSGAVNGFGVANDSDTVAVRPAMYVNISEN